MECTSIPNEANTDHVISAFTDQVNNLIHIARLIPDHQKADAKNYLSSSISKILEILDTDNSYKETSVSREHLNIESFHNESKDSSNIDNSKNIVQALNKDDTVAFSQSDRNEQINETDFNILNEPVLLSRTTENQLRCNIQTIDFVKTQVDDLENSELNSKADNTLQFISADQIQTELEKCKENCPQKYSENKWSKTICEVKDKIENISAQNETTLLDDVESIKPKSNSPSGKDASLETDDVSSLLSFLPQLSPYIKFDSQDPSIGDRDGYIHLTVERADGSVHNLKIGGVVGPVVDGEEGQGETIEDGNNGDKQNNAWNQSSDEKIDQLQEGEQQQSSEQEISIEKDTNPEEMDSEKDGSSDAEQKPQYNGRPRGRPKKPQIFTPVHLEDDSLVYKCQFCPDTVKSQHAMIVHLRKHTGEKPFSCPLCGKSFTTKGNMKQHERTTHSSHKPWACSHCDKAFKEKKVLMVHERTHTGERPYKCHVCAKSFSQPGVLKEHLLVHTGQKPHLCDLCGQEFRGASALKAHKARHLNKRDFKCDQCEKAFVSKVDLKRHIQTHTGVKPFLCSYCPKSFTRLNYLKEHLNLHRGLKPFTCRDCGVAFAESTTLHRHRKKHKSESEEQSNSKQSELEKELIAGSETVIQTPEALGQTAVQLVLDENTTNEDFQRLQSLVLSTVNGGGDYLLTSQDAVKQMYQVLCVNPDTQEIASVHGADGQTDFSAINLLANATAQQYTL